MHVNSKALRAQKIGQAAAEGIKTTLTPAVRVIKMSTGCLPPLSFVVKRTDSLALALV